MRKKTKRTSKNINKESASRDDPTKNEVNSLNFAINEQKLSIENPKSFAKEDIGEQDGLPSEVQILKELVTSQRKDLNRQNKKIDELNEKLDGFNIEIKDSQEGNSKESEILVAQLSNENEELRERISSLQPQIESSQIKTDDSDWDFDEEVETGEDLDLTNLKQLNFQLMEENGLLRVEVESLKTELQSGIARSEELANNKIEGLKTEIDSLKIELQNGVEMVSSEELVLANNKIEVLKAEIDDYQAQIKYIQEINKRESEPQQIVEENVDELSKLKDELLEYQKENLVLNDMSIDLKEEDKMESDEEIYPSNAFTIPKQVPLSLFNRIYNLLNTKQKRIVKNILIQDLTSNYVEVKRDTIKMLSQIKDIEIYDAFINMIHDKDWIIRLYVIKALSAFENKQEELIDLMKELSSDVDVDVRELAVKVLYNITRN